MFDNLSKLIEDYNEAKRQFASTAQEEFKRVLKNYFDECPEIKTIRWSQYTPYFNDGETCEFNVNDPYFSNADPKFLSDYGELEVELEKDDEPLFSDYNLKREEKVSQNTAKLSEELSKIICSQAMEDVMLAMFGDHACVTVTRDGIDVEEYDHE